MDVLVDLLGEMSMAKSIAEVNIAAGLALEVLLNLS